MFLCLGNILVNITGLFLVEIPVFFFFFTFIFHFLTFYKIFLYTRKGFFFCILSLDDLTLKNCDVDERVLYIYIIV